MTLDVAIKVLLVAIVVGLVGLVALAAWEYLNHMFSWARKLDIDEDVWDD